MPIVRRSALLGILIQDDEDQKHIRCTTKYRVGAWDEDKQEWVGLPKIEEEDLHSGVTPERAKINSALSVALANALAKIGDQSKRIYEMQAFVNETAFEKKNLAIYLESEHNAHAAAVVQISEAKEALGHKTELVSTLFDSLNKAELEVYYRKRWYHRLTGGLFVRFARGMT